MSSFNLLSLGTQAVRANQTALGVVGQNISNVNTEGYSRQVVHFNSVVPSGVKLEDVERVTNEFLTRQFWADNSSYERADTYTNLALEADKLLGQDITNASKTMDAFFSTLQHAVDEPAAIAHRELLLTEAHTTTARFNDLYSNINLQHEKINARIDDSIDAINLHAASVARYNDEIRLAEARGDSTNELQDHREVAIIELSKLTDLEVISHDNGMQDVHVANGQPLVIGIQASSLYTYSSEFHGSENKIGIDIAGTRTDVTAQMSGGTIGGALDYRAQVLNPTLNELGRISITLGMTMNDVQLSGMDLNNALGDRLFTDMNTTKAMRERVLGDTGNKGSYSYGLARITDVTRLTANEYSLTLQGKDEFSITNLTTGEVMSQDDFREVTSSIGDVSDNTYYLNESTGQLRLEIDGFQFDLDSRNDLVRGDKFLIQPTRRGAELIDSEMTDPRKLALASPIRANTAPENTGTGTITVDVTDISSQTFQKKEGELEPPVRIVFSGSGDALTYTAYNVKDPANPEVLDIGNGPVFEKPYVAGEAIDLGGYAATIINEPKAGDTFSFEYNTDGVSDNRNALKMSDLQHVDFLDAGSYQDAYSGLLERVAGKTAGAKIITASNKAVLESTADARSSVSGVNMDEEAARLVQFQQAYQASAQIISVSQKLFDTILNI